MTTKTVDENGNKISGSSYDGQMLDITGPELCEIQVRQDGKVIWVNVDGRCVLRVCQIEKLLMK